MKKVAILQSNYIPWKGYFDIINRVDEFILYDDMQYTKRDWRNRNKIVTPQGLQWLTIPVVQKGKYFQKINETITAGSSWVDEHWKAIKYNYSHSEFFKEYSDRILSVYDACRKEEYLSRINYLFIAEICAILDINTKISWSSDYELADGKTERLIKLVESAGGDYYLSGPAAKDYIEPELFSAAGIELDWMVYSGYREYKQQYGQFEHGVSILDLLFNLGANAKDYITSGGTENELSKSGIDLQGI